MSDQAQWDEEETYIGQPHQTPLKGRNERLPLTPAHDGVQRLFPLLQIILLLFQRVLHLWKFLLPARTFLYHWFSQDARHPKVEIRLPQLERCWEVLESGFIEVRDTLQVTSWQRCCKGSQEFASLIRQVLLWFLKLQLSSEGIPSALDRRPPCSERVRISQEIFFTVEVLDGDEIRMGLGLGNGEGEWEERGQLLEGVSFLRDGGHRGGRTRWGSLPIQSASPTLYWGILSHDLVCSFAVGYSRALNGIIALSRRWSYCFASPPPPSFRNQQRRQEMVCALWNWVAPLDSQACLLVQHGIKRVKETPEAREAKKQKERVKIQEFLSLSEEILRRVRHEHSN